MAYDEAGQLQNASFMDFLMPYVSEVPDGIEIDHLETPSPLNPLGIKGAGEAGRDPERGGVRLGHLRRRGVRDHLDADLAERAVRVTPSAVSAPFSARRGRVMKVAGQATLHAPIERVFAALNDPAVLVRTIPGCQRLEATGPDAYAMTVTAGVASIKGSYAGSVQLAELQPPNSFVLRASGAGGPGTVSADVSVRLSERDGVTVLDYDADAVVGGMIGGVGQRMLAGVAKKLAGEFFADVDEVLTGTAAPPAGETLAAGRQPTVYRAPRPRRRIGARERADFVHTGGGVRRGDRAGRGAGRRPGGQGWQQAVRR